MASFTIAPVTREGGLLFREETALTTNLGHHKLRNVGTASLLARSRYVRDRLYLLRQKRTYLTGDEYIDYVLRANGGQLMIATLEVADTNGNGSANFNILPAGADFPALYNSANTGEMSGSIVLPEDGDWAIRVYLMGNDRDTDKTVGYTLHVSIQ